MHTEKEHRQRVRDRFIREGLDGFDPVHALEFLLFYAIPRVDTKPTARALLDRFASFHGVLEASTEELQTVPGIGENAAVFLQLIRQTCRYYSVDRSKDITIFNTVEEYGRYLYSCFAGRSNETVFLLCLDAKCKMLCCRMIGEGDLVSINLPFRRVVEIALNVKAAAVVLAHNHPSGLAVPSHEDVSVTNQLRQALQTMGIVLLDHIVVSDDDYVSMSQSGYMD